MAGQMEEKLGELTIKKASEREFFTKNGVAI